MSAANPSSDPVPSKARGRRARVSSIPIENMPAGNLSESQSPANTQGALAPGGDGRAPVGVGPRTLNSPVVANSDPSPSKARGRQATSSTLTFDRSLGGSPPESQVLAVTQGPLALGGDGGAQNIVDRQQGRSPAVANIDPVPSKARGRQVSLPTYPTRALPAGNTSESQVPADSHGTTALGGDDGALRSSGSLLDGSPVVANTDPSPSEARGRQANDRASTTHDTPAGNASESRSSNVLHHFDALGGDGGAHWVSASHRESSPAVANSDPSIVKKRGRQANITAQPMESAPVGKSPEGQRSNDTHHCVALGGDGGAHLADAFQLGISPVVAETIQLWRMRQRWHRAEKALILQGRALCRGWTEGDKAEANRLFDEAADGKAVDAGLAMALSPFLAAIAGFRPERAGIEKRLRKLARELSFWPWVGAVKGFGDLNLAAIVGEAGEIASYRNPSCLWKRMGLAVINGERQRRKTDAAEAAAHGYNPRRRTVAYLLGDTLIKAGDGNRYRPVYTERRAHTAETHPDWTKARSHNDAARVMTKRVLRDLWIEARRLSDAEAA